MDPINLKAMKKYTYLLFLALFAALSFTMVSCGDDDDDDASGNAIAGTWVGKLYEQSDPDYYADETEVVTMTFTDDGKMTAKGVDPEHHEYDWSFRGDYRIQSLGTTDPTKYQISMSGYFAGDDEFYDDDIEFRVCTIVDNTLYIFFDGNDYRLFRQ